MPVTPQFTPTGESRSMHSCHPRPGTTLLVFRRSAPRGWLWQGLIGQGRGSSYGEGRAATRAAAETAALEWAAA